MPATLVQIFEDQVNLLNKHIAILKALEGHAPSTPSAEDGKKKKKEKKEKSDKPKRPPSAYNLFMIDTLKKMKETGNAINNKEMMNFVSKQWSELDAKAKHDYTERADKLKHVVPITEGSQVAAVIAPAPVKTTKVTKGKTSAAAVSSTPAPVPVISSPPPKPVQPVETPQVFSAETPGGGEETEKKKKKKKKKHHGEEDREDRKVRPLSLLPSHC